MDPNFTSIWILGCLHGDDWRRRKAALERRPWCTDEITNLISFSISISPPCPNLLPSHFPPLGKRGAAHANSHQIFYYFFQLSTLKWEEGVSKKKQKKVKERERWRRKIIIRCPRERDFRGWTSLNGSTLVFPFNCWRNYSTDVT